MLRVCKSTHRYSERFIIMDFGLFDAQGSFLFHWILFVLNFPLIVSAPPLAFICLIHFILLCFFYVIWRWLHCCKKHTVGRSLTHSESLPFPSIMKQNNFLFNTDEFGPTYVTLFYVLWWVWDFFFSVSLIGFCLWLRILLFSFLAIWKVYFSPLCYVIIEFKMFLFPSPILSHLCNYKFN